MTLPSLKGTIGGFVALDVALATALILPGWVFVSVAAVAVAFLGGYVAGRV